MNRMNKLVVSLALLLGISAMAQAQPNTPANGMSELEGKARQATARTEDEALFQKYVESSAMYMGNGVLILKKDVFTGNQNLEPSSTERIELLHVLHEFARLNVITISSFSIEKELKGFMTIKDTTTVAIWFTYSR